MKNTNLLWAFASLCVVLQTASAEERVINFSIPPQSAATALDALATQSDLQMLFNREALKNSTTQGLTGRFTARDALKKLLAGTGLTYTFTADDAVAVKPAPEQLNKAEPATLKPMIVSAEREYDATDPYNEDYVLPNATAGTKTDTPIMETPLNVQVISKQVMKDQQVITLGDALKNVSGVTVNTQGDLGGFTLTNSGTAANITLRGFASETYFRNGFRLQQGAGQRQMANVESVEVLKGPAAILYGLVEPGGMVNVITKQPQATPYYALNQQFGSYNLYRTTLDATGPVAGNKDVLYRMNMSYQNSGSFQDFVGTEDVFLAPVLKWNITPKTQATIEFEYNRQHQGLGSSFNPYIGGQLLNIPLSRNYGEYSPAITETFFGSFNWSHQFNDDWAIKHRFSANQQSFTANNYTVPSIAANGDTFASIYGTGFPGLEVVRETIGNVSKNNTYSTNLDLTGHFDTFGLKHTVLLGGDYYRLNNAGRVLRTSPGQFSIIDPFNPVHPGIPLNAPQADASLGNQQQTDQYGLYGQDQIKLPYDVHVTGGLRYQYLHQNTLSTQAGSADSTAALSQDAVTPRVGILWHPQSWISLYANYAESFGANTGLVFVSPTQVKPISPTSASQYEGGIKTEFFGGRLRATLAYYDLTKTNVAAGDPNQAHNCGGGPGSCALAIGAIRSRGPELDIQGEILPGWNAIATWANTDIIVTKTNATNDSLNGINVGGRMINVPRNTGSFWSTYEFQQSDLKGLKFGGGITVRNGQIGTGGSDLNGVNLPVIKTPGYATLGLMTAYSRVIGKSKVTLQLNIDNLLDKRYFTSINGNFNDSAGVFGAYAAYGAPRTAMGSISIQY